MTQTGRPSGAKVWIHRIWVALLLAGIIQFCVESYQGSGLSGRILRWEIDTLAHVREGLATTVSFLLLVLLPFGMAVRTASSRSGASSPRFGPMVLFGGIAFGLGSFAAVAFWMSNHSPDPGAKPVRIDVGAPSADWADGMAQLSGVAQNTRSLSYISSWSLGEGVSRASGTDRRILAPITVPDWKTGQPIRFLIATTKPFHASGPIPPGMLLRNALPWYQRSVLESHGLTLADPYFILNTDAYAATRGNWDALAAISGFFALLMLACGVGISRSNVP